MKQLLAMIVLALEMGCEVKCEPRCSPCPACPEPPAAAAAQPPARVPRIAMTVERATELGSRQEVFTYDGIYELESRCRGGKLYVSPTMAFCYGPADAESVVVRWSFATYDFERSERDCSAACSYLMARP